MCKAVRTRNGLEPVLYDASTKQGIGPQTDREKRGIPKVRNRPEFDRFKEAITEEHRNGDVLGKVIIDHNEITIEIFD